MNKLFYLLAIIGLLVACSYEGQEIPGETLPVVDGSIVKTTEIVSLSDYQIHEPSGLLKSGQQMIVGDRMNYDHVYRINLNDGSREGMLPRVRTREGGVTMFQSLASDGRGGWTVLDCRNGKLDCTSSVLTRAGSGSSVQLPKEVRHLWATRAGNYIVATGIYPEGRYLLYSLEDGQSHYSVTYPDHPWYPALQERTKAFLYASNVLRARPDGEAFVCADMYSGIMDICRINDGEVSLIRRLIYHYPRVQIAGKGDWPQVVYSKDNRFGFTDVCVTEKSIYALYSGLTYRMEKENFQYCRTLIEVGWDGIVKSTRSIDVALTQLTYDAQEKTLYGIAWNPDATLVRLTSN